MSFQEWLPGFNPLVKKIAASISKNGLAKGSGHDPATVRRWLVGSEPQHDAEVASVISYALENGIEIDPFQSFAPIYDFSPMLGYQQTLELGPKSFEWLTHSHVPPTVPTSFLGMKFDCPLGIASSPLMGTERWVASMLNLGYGPSTFKTRRKGRKSPWDPPLVALVLERPNLLKYDPQDPPEVLVSFGLAEVKGHIPDLVNSIGVPSEDPAQWQETYEKIRKHPGGESIILSVMGDGESCGDVFRDYMDAVVQARAVSPPAVELNVSCPNREKGAGDVLDDPDLVARICRGASERLKGTDTRLVLKISYLPYEKMKILVKKVAGIVDAIAFRNTIKVRPVKLNRDQKREPAFPGRTFGGLSGPGTFGHTVRGLRDLMKVKQETRASFAVIAIGGISTADEVVQLQSIGVDVIQACTAPIFDPFLAWKTSFHIHRLRHSLQSQESTDTSRCSFLIHPRNEMERECFKNAEKAVREIRRRDAGLVVTHEHFMDKWNTWMRGRSNALLGQAQRRAPSIRTTSDWIKTFTS